tara:strand:- start:60 stop:1292 length:1233 start_codon:yes stop_codon:yes gene_type:complete
MTTRAGTYFPIRASGYKPAPAPYWNELINAQNLVGIGTAGLLTQVPNIIDNSNSLLSNKSAQDIINSHLSQENNYKTWDFGYKMSEADARAKGYIIPPKPTVTEEERKRSLTLPNIPPEIEQGWVEDFPIDDSKFPTHTGGGILEPPTFKDMTSGGGFTLLDEKDKIPNILYTLKTIYHGTDKDFDEFDIEQSSDGSIWFTDDKKAIENREVGASGFGRIIERQIDEGKLKLATSDQKDKYLDDQLIAQGYDGVKFAKEEGYDDNSYRIFFPEKLLDVSYRLESPSEDNARLDDLTQTFPDDIYSSNAIRYYGNPNNLADIESNEIIQEARGNPDMEVTIYRAVPNDADITSINEGDFVTLSKTYAEEHGAGGYGAMGNEAGKILTKKVKVKDLVTGGNDLNEFGYYPVK